MSGLGYHRDRADGSTGAGRCAGSRATHEGNA
jgi:hypothetical protein